MARSGRIKSTFGAYHVILRGQKKIFSSDADVNEFFSTLKKYFDNNISHLFAFSIEPKKIHLVLKSEIDINKLIKPLCTSYARYINRTRSNNGKIFYDRFISEPLENFDEITDAIIYVHNKLNAKTSYTEYHEKQEFCSINEIIKENKHDLIIKNKCKRFFIDDYMTMSDKELHSMLLACSEKKQKELSNDDKDYLIEIAVKNSNLSKTRVASILNVKTSNIRYIEKAPKKNQQQKKELNYWLL